MNDEQRRRKAEADAFLKRIKEANMKYKQMNEEEREEYKRMIFRDYPVDHPDRRKAGY